MYCPQCNSEYREGFTTCAECNVPLAEGSPQDSAESAGHEESGLRVLLETTHPTFLDPIVVRLEESGIPYIVQSGTALSLLQGLISENLPEDWKAIVLVSAEHLNVARSILSESSEQQSESNQE